jgi:hypothetical protein
MTSSIQKKGILKTVFITLGLMALILILFFNKITTPRYLSNIELKINQLELLKTPIVVAHKNQNWLLIFSSQQQQKVLLSFTDELRKSISERTAIIALEDLAPSKIDLPYDSQEAIGIMKPNGELIAYFRPPFDQHKMILTYSSVFTHR